MRWSELIDVVRRNLPVEEGVGWFFIQWVLEGDGGPRGQAQIARLVVVPEGEHLELVCPLARAPIHPARLLAATGALAVGAPVLLDGRAGLRHVLAMSALDELTLLRRMGQLAGEALALRQLLAQG